MKTQNSLFTTIRRILYAGAALLMAATAFGAGPVPFTATFDANGGEGGGSIQVPAGGPLVAPEVTRTGYTLAGWEPEVPATMPAGDVTYVAQWTQTSFTATFDANGGEGGGSILVPAGEPLVAPKVTWTGYTLAGWAPEVPATMPAGDVTYKAKWKVTIYNVVFKKGVKGVKGKMKSQTFAYDHTYRLRKNKFRRKGFKFGGWATTKKDGKKGVVAYYNYQQVKNLSEKGGTVVLFAVWGKKPYKVKFYANGGHGKMKKESFEYGKSKKLLKNKFKASGYVFKGWATTRYGEVKYKDRQKVKNLTNKGKTVKLYAVWEKM